MRIVLMLAGWPSTGSLWLEADADADADADLVLMVMVMVLCPGEQKDQEKPWQHHTACQVSISTISILHPHDNTDCQRSTIATNGTTSGIICFSQDGLI